MSDYDTDSDDDLPFPLLTRGYLYEPEYTEEELLQRETEREERERRETAMESAGQDDEERERVQSTWWCSLKPNVWGYK